MNTAQSRIKSKGALSGDLATVPEIAKSLNMAPKTLYAWISAGRIPFLKIGRCVRFDREQIATWLSSKSKRGMS